MFKLYIFDNSGLIDIETIRNPTILWQSVQNHKYIFSDPDYPDYTESDGPIHCVSVDSKGEIVEY